MEPIEPKMKPASIERGMKMVKSQLEKAFAQGQGILRLAPTWVPRAFCRPGRRIKLHPDDYYVLGTERGAIDERWFASTTRAENGPKTPADEGLSYVVLEGPDAQGATGAQGAAGAQGAVNAERMLLRDAVEALQGQLIGEELWDKYHKWPMFSKFFDNLGPLPHHIHHRNVHANRVGREGKPEMYFFPSQVNNYGGEFPFTFFGLNPGTRKEDVKRCLEDFAKGDNQLLDLSRCYKLALDTGWDVPPGVLHAPGSLCTYEPQYASDVYSMYQSVLLGGHCVSDSLLWANTPPEEMGNVDYLLQIIDWDVNVDPDFYAKRFMAPIPVKEVAVMAEEGYLEEWICYKCELASAKRLTVEPGRTVTISDSAAYGFILLQGFGTCGAWHIETPTLIRYGEITSDEFFVSAATAKQGVTITNLSSTEPLVLLKHFAENPDLKIEVHHE